MGNVSERTLSGQPRQIRAIVSKLLEWFAKNARDLPWRRTSDPYAIWISEIMLQQTQVATVIPYWKRWMAALPSPAHLAKAKVDDVLKLWEGLGYYRRARNLHAAAAQIVESHGGAFPQHFDDVLNLPGIGRYTAGAICSIAYNQPAPILDGNVIRLLTRLWAISGDPKSRAVNDRLWSLASELVQAASNITSAGRRSCSDLNQSLMELGALVCTPKNPRCGECPLSKQCEARRLGQIGRFPQTCESESISARHVATVIIQKGSRWRLRQRPADVVNAGFWEFPGLEVPEATGGLAALTEWLGAQPESLKRVGKVSHSITRFRFHQEVYHLTVENGTKIQVPEGRWLTAAEIHKLALTSAHRKIVAMLDNA